MRKFTLSLGDAGELVYEQDKFWMVRGQKATELTVPPRAAMGVRMDGLGELSAPEDATSQVAYLCVHGGDVVGKGNDGIVFKVDEMAVKVSTSIPFNPFNTRQFRTIDEAMALIEMHHRESLEMSGLNPTVLSGRRGVDSRAFLTSEWLDTETNLGWDAIKIVIDHIRDHVRAGFYHADDIQVGLNKQFEPKFYDWTLVQLPKDKNQRKYALQDMVLFLTRFVTKRAVEGVKYNGDWRELEAR